MEDLASSVSDVLSSTKAQLLQQRLFGINSTHQQQQLSESVLNNGLKQPIQQPQQPQPQDNPNDNNANSRVIFIGSANQSPSNLSIASNNNGGIPISNLSSATANNEQDNPASDSDEFSANEKRPKRQKAKHFTPDEDEKIIEGVKKFSQNWEEIVKWGQMERTASQIRVRWGRLKQRDEQGVILENNNSNSGRRTTKHRKLSEETNNGNISSPCANNSLLVTTPRSPNIQNPSSIITSLTMQNSEYLSKNTELTSRLNQLEKENKELKELKEEFLRQEQEWHRREENFKKYEEQLRKQVTEDEREELLKTERIKKVLQNLLVQLALQEREIARTRHFQQCHRLGKLSLERHGASYVEVWQDGQVFKDLLQRQTILLEEREHMERAKKEISRKIKKKIGENDTNESVAELEELLQQEEILKIRISNNKKEDAEINAEREKLLPEKNRHIRELKRIYDENQSRFNNNQILKERYVLLNLLGKGGFSEVYKAFDLESMTEVACKLHQLNTQWNDRKKENYIKHACREYSIHKSVVHPKIVQLYDVFEIDDNSFCTVLEYCNGQDLDLYLKSNQTLGERESKSIISQIFSGLAYLSEQKRPIIHYDLKPGNILFHNGEVKITDFGLSKVLEEDQESVELTSQGAGTYWYLPPECFEINGNQPPKISSKVDVWSAGVILYQMLYGKKPFGNNLSQQKILSDNIISNSSLEFPAKPVVSKEAKEFIRKCLSHSLATRPDVKTCCMDPFLKLYSGIINRKEKKKDGKET